MAVLLYKKGDSSEIRGVKCDFIRCDIKEMEIHLKNGYVTKLEDLEDKPEPKPKRTRKKKDAE